MKKIILALAAAGLFAACNNKPEENKVVETPQVVEEKQPISFPYAPSYSSDFTMGDPQLAKHVLDMYKAVENNQIDSLGKFYEDTVIRYNFNQRLMKLSREEMVKLSKDFRSQFKEFSETPLAWVSLHANDKNEDWVCTWIKEKVTYANGKMDSTVYQENWRFRNGKIYMVDSYAKYAK